MGLHVLIVAHLMKAFYSLKICYLNVSEGIKIVYIASYTSYLLSIIVIIIMIGLNPFESRHYQKKK
jgi:hypothetical protein